jgi:hypothetical protein
MAGRYFGGRTEMTRNKTFKSGNELSELRIAECKAAAHKELREMLGRSVLLCSVSLSRVWLTTNSAALPSKADLATLFCQRFFFSELWLATGDGPRRIHLFLRLTPEFAKVPPGSKFTEAFDKHLRPVAVARTKGHSLQFIIKSAEHFRRFPDRSFFTFGLGALFEQLLDDLPAEHHGWLFEMLIVTAHLTLNKFSQGNPKPSPSRQSASTTSNPGRDEKSRSK